MKRFLLALLLFATSLASALEPQDPVTLCDRFLEGLDKAQCEQKMKTLGPDWYLATVCNQNFNDQSFYSCVELSKTGVYSPKKLETCTEEGMSDENRMLCVKAARSTTQEAYQQRQPAATKSRRPQQKKIENLKSGN